MSIIFPSHSVFLFKVAMRLFPWIPATFAANQFTEALSAGIDGFVKAQNASTTTNLVTRLLGPVVKYSLNVAVSSLRTLVKPLVRNNPDQIAADVVLTVKALANGTYSVITGTKFLPFVMAIGIKVFVWIVSAYFVRALVSFILHGLVHYFHLRDRAVMYDNEDVKRPKGKKRRFQIVD